MQSVWRGFTEFVVRGCWRNWAHGCSHCCVGNGFDLSVVQNTIIFIAIFFGSELYLILCNNAKGGLMFYNIIFKQSKRMKVVPDVSLPRKTRDRFF